MTSPIRFEQDADHIVTLTFDQAGSPVNTMTPEWHNAMLEASAKIVAMKDSIAGVILASAKTTFFAGAELKGILQLKDSDAPDMFRRIEAIKKAWRALETCGKPIVACINGAALGGGWETALVAHHRVALDNPKIQLGLPEVTIGLMPGATGVTKMVRHLGLLAALPFLMEGKLFNPREARALGLVHALAETPEAMFDAARAWIKANPNATQPWDDKGYRMPGGAVNTPAVSQSLAIGPAMLIEKTRGLLPAPKAILSAMVEGARVDYDTATRIESRYLAQLAVGQVAKNQVSAFFFNLNAIKSGASVKAAREASGVKGWKPKRVGVLGAGMMGSGIAWANANRGIACVLKDVNQEAADKGKAYSAKLLDKRVKQGRMDEVKAAGILNLIHATANNEDLRGCDLIIEAVFEQRPLKAQVTKETEALLAADGFFASNTSTLPISGLAQASAHPEKFIGLHFFSPVDKMQLVEIIKGAKTDAQTLARAYDYVLAIGKTPIVVNDSRGFFTSRTFGTFVREGACMLQEGIPAAVIENAARQAGMPVGPLAVIDETSMSLSLHVLNQTRADYAAEGKTYAPNPGEEVFERMVTEFKRPGRAGGGGFYDYPKDGRKQLWGDLKRVFERADVAYDVAELKQRFLYRQAIETARCLEEGVLETVHDGNIGSIFGIGFPVWTGGALQYINSEGVANFVATADALKAKYGARFAVPQSVRDKAQAGALFA